MRLTGNGRNSTGRLAFPSCRVRRIVALILTLSAIGSVPSYAADTTLRSGPVKMGGALVYPDSTQPMGDVDHLQDMVDFGGARILIGNYTYASARYGINIGSQNIQSSDIRPDNVASQWKNVFGTILGNYNSNESFTADKGLSGSANSLMGLANRVSGSNGSLVAGVGNTVSHAYAENDLPSVMALLGVPRPSQNALIDWARREALGAAIVHGTGNQMDYALSSQISGNHNQLLGTPESYVTQTQIRGADNHVERSSKTQVYGNSNTVTDASNSIVIGDQQKVTGATGAVIIGSASAVRTTTAPNVVAIGADAQAQAENSIALGAKSVASVLAGVTGWSPNASATATDPTWTATMGALSIGDTTASAVLTRQITGVAAGSADTDAVNVAQLKAVYNYARSVGSSGTQTTQLSSVSVNGGSAQTPNGSGPQNLVITTSTNASNGPHYDIQLADTLTLGNDPTTHQITIDGNRSRMTLGALDHPVTIDGQAGTIDGLQNTTWDAQHYTSGRAATEDQLYQATRANDERFAAMENHIDNLNDELRDTGASAAALAGLRALQYDPLEPTQLMAALGTYRGRYALSVGLAHYPSERVMVHAGVALNQYPMANIGVSFKFGGKSFKGYQGETYTAAAPRYAAGPITASYVMQKELTQTGAADAAALRDEMKALRDKNAGLENDVATLKTQNKAIVEQNAQLVKEMKALKALVMKMTSKH